MKITGYMVEMSTWNKPLVEEPEPSVIANMNANRKNSITTFWLIKSSPSKVGGTFEESQRQHNPIELIF